MQKTFIKFVVGLAASIGLLSVGAMGVAGASSISNTGPGSSNYISGGGGNISTTGPGSVNVIGGGCGNSCGGGCWNNCEVPVVVQEDKKDCDKPKPVVKHKHYKWCWQNHHWCLRQV